MDILFQFKAIKYDSNSFLSIKAIKFKNQALKFFIANRIILKNNKIINIIHAGKQNHH
jgi:hypothetical protein